MSVLSSILQPIGALIENTAATLIGSAESALAPRLDIPAADLAEVAADTANYTANGVALTTDQVQAADKAIIDYVANRLNTAIIQPLQSLVSSATKSAAKPIPPPVPLVTPSPIVSISSSNPASTSTVTLDGAGNPIDSSTGLPPSDADLPNPNASTEEG